jgi:excisionase family DNA binding protein
MTDRLVDVKELARILNLPVSWIYQRTMQGPTAIPHIKFGKHLRFNPEEVMNFFQDKECKRWGIGNKGYEKHR